MPPLVSFAELDLAIRAAWRQAGHQPTWQERRDVRGGITARTFRLLTPHFAAFGRRSDGEIAAAITGGSRSHITTLRRCLGIPRYVRPSMGPAAEEACREQIRQGRPLTAIAAALGVPWSSVRRVARTLGWARSWVVRPARGRSNHVGRLAKAEVAALLSEGLTLPAVARRAGVSHQRIVQVRDELGLPSQTERHRRRRELARQRAERERRARRKRWLAERARRPARRRAKLRRFLARARRLYARGWSARRIAAAYGIPTRSMAWWIYIGRTQLGWFPKRRGEAGLPAAVTHDRLSDVCRAYGVQPVL